MRRSFTISSCVSLCLLVPLVASAQFTLVETGGTLRTDAANLAATANGATAIGQDELGLGTHFITNINNGTYGNASSWIGGEVMMPTTVYVPVVPGYPPMPMGIVDVVGTTASHTSWIGVQFATPVTIASLALGRDNTGALTDRTPTSYLIEYTTSTEWVPLGTIATSLSPEPSLRNLYNLDTPLTGVVSLRIVTSTGASYGSAIDELEVYATAAAIPEPSTYAALAGLGALGLALWRRRRTPLR